MYIHIMYIFFYRLIERNRSVKKEINTLSVVFLCFSFLFILNLTHPGCIKNVSLFPYTEHKLTGIFGGFTGLNSEF